MRAALTPAEGPAVRFRALWQLWQLVDERAREAAIDPASGSEDSAVRP